MTGSATAETPASARIAQPALKLAAPVSAAFSVEQPDPAPAPTLPLVSDQPRVPRRAA